MGLLWLNEANGNPIPWGTHPPEQNHTLQQKTRKRWMLGKKGTVCNRSLSSSQTTWGLKKSTLKENVAFSKEEKGYTLESVNVLQTAHPLQTSGIQKAPEGRSPVHYVLSAFFNLISLFLFPLLVKQVYNTTFLRGVFWGFLKLGTWQALNKSHLIIAAKWFRGTKFEFLHNPGSENHKRLRMWRHLGRLLELASHEWQQGKNHTRDFVEKGVKTHTEAPDAQRTRTCVTAQQTASGSQRQVTGPHDIWLRKSRRGQLDGGAAPAEAVLRPRSRAGSWPRASSRMTPFPAPPQPRTFQQLLTPAAGSPHGQHRVTACNDTGRSGHRALGPLAFPVTDAHGPQKQVPSTAVPKRWCWTLPRGPTLVIQSSRPWWEMAHPTSQNSGSPRHQCRGAQGWAGNSMGVEPKDLDSSSGFSIAWPWVSPLGLWASEDLIGQYIHIHQCFVTYKVPGKSINTVIITFSVCSLTHRKINNFAQGNPKGL